MAFPTHIVAAAGFTEDGKGNILMVRTHHHGWIYPGGQIENGESIPNGVIRETKEESGIDIEVGPLVGIYSNTGSYVWHDGKTFVPTKVMFDFICYYKGGELGTSEETMDSMWVPKEKVIDLLDRDIFKLRYQAYLDFAKRVLYAEYSTRPEYTLKSKRYI